MAQAPKPTNVISQLNEQRAQRNKNTNTFRQKENLVIAVNGYDKDEHGKLFMTGFDPHDPEQTPVQVYIAEKVGNRDNGFSMERFIDGEKANDKHDFDIPAFEIQDDPNDSMAIFERAVKSSEGVYQAEFARKIPQGNIISKCMTEVRITPSKQNANVTIHATSAAKDVKINDANALVETIANTLNARDNALRGANVRLIAKDASGKLQFKGMHFKQIYVYDDEAQRNVPMTDGQEWLQTLDSKVKQNTASDFEISMYENLQMFIQIASSNEAKDLEGQAKWEVIPTSTYPISKNFKRKLFTVGQEQIGHSKLMDTKIVLSNTGQRLFNQYAAMKEPSHASRVRMLVDSHVTFRNFEDGSNGMYMTDLIPTKQFTSGYVPIEVPTVNTDCKENLIHITRRNSKMLAMLKNGISMDNKEPTQSKAAPQPTQAPVQAAEQETTTSVTPKAEAPKAEAPEAEAPKQTSTVEKPKVSTSASTETIEKTVDTAPAIEPQPEATSSAPEAAPLQEAPTETPESSIADEHSFESDYEDEPEIREPSMSELSEDDNWFADVDMSELFDESGLDDVEEAEQQRTSVLGM